MCFPDMTPNSRSEAPNIVDPPHSSSSADESQWTAPVIIRSTMLTGIFILMLLYTLYFAAPILMPITLAFLLSMLLSPLVRGLAKIHIPRTVGAAIVLITLLVFISVAVSWLAAPATAWMDRAPQIFQEITVKLQTLKRPIEEVQEAAGKVEKMAKLSDGDPQDVVVSVKEPDLVRLILSGTPKVIAGTGLIIILMYFLLASGDLFLRKLVTVIPRLEDKKRAVEIVRSIQHDISSYLFTITLINIGLGAAVAIAMYLLEVPNPILWGVMVAAFNFAPYIGAITSVTILTVVGILSFESLSQALLVPAVGFGLTTLEGQFITPLIVGHRLELSPVIIFVGLIIWGWLWGLIGILLAVPLLASFKIICEGLESFRPIAEFMGRSIKSPSD
jgi:predicted PurR-regulated permease PerM